MPVRLISYMKLLFVLAQLKAARNKIHFACCVALIAVLFANFCY